MKSVTVDGIVRLTGETVIAAYGRTVLMDSEAVTHNVIVKNLKKGTVITLSYTAAERKRPKLKLQPGKSVAIEFSVSSFGREIRANDLVLKFVLNEIEEQEEDADTVICPKCKTRLQADEIGYCPTCGDGE